jgi:hypothetical protein
MPRRTCTTPALTSTSPRRSSASSPNRSPHHDADSTMTRNRSGIAATSASSSARLAGRIRFARRAEPPPRTRHGLAAMSSSASAVLRMVRNRP